MTLTLAGRSGSKWLIMDYSPNNFTDSDNSWGDYYLRYVDHLVREKRVKLALFRDLMSQLYRNVSEMYQTSRDCVFFNPHTSCIEWVTVTMFFKVK